MLHAFVPFALAACLGTPATEIPIPRISTAIPDSPNRSLIVMLPGMGDRADTFIKTGFLRAGEPQDFDVLAVDAHFGYYRDRSLVIRLHEDIIVPAESAGYEHIWLLGISMGGFGSLLYAEQHPDMVAGVILLAPFLGEPETAQEISAAGGLQSWSRGDASGLEARVLDVWTWLKDATTGAGGTPIVLGFGHSDRLSKSYGPLIEALEPSRVYQMDGGHKWTTWSPLWARISADLKQLE